MMDLFTTITNANFDEESITKRIENTLQERDAIKQRLITKGVFEKRIYPDYATWTARSQ